MAEDLVEVDEFTPAVTVPEDGDDRDAASVKQGFQPLTNRARYLLNRAGLGPGGTTHVWNDQHSFTNNVRLTGASNEIEYGDAAGVATLRLRTKVFRLSGTGSNGSGGVWESSGDGGVRLISGVGYPAPFFSAELPLVTGSVLTGWRLTTWSAIDAGPVNVRGSVRLVRQPFAGSAAYPGTEKFTTGLAPEDLSESGLYEAITSNATWSLHLAITTLQNTASIIFGMAGGVELSWLDPGPRNY